MQQGLFSSNLELDPNLPDCMVYKPHFMTRGSAHSLYQYLVEAIQWQQPVVRVWGQDHQVPRLQYWMGEVGQDYQYSGKIFTASDWIPILKELKQQVERVCQSPFNSVLLNWYRNGEDKMGWHADNEVELGTMPSIAMVSLGETRTFQYRHNDNQVTESLEISNGSLLLMKPGMQSNYQHQVPTRKKISSGRISLTFRNILK